MLRCLLGVLGKCSLFLLAGSVLVNGAFAQMETATISGQVVDPTGLRITGAQVKLVDIDRDTTTGTATNPSGLYTFPSVRPGRYRMEVTAPGFKVVNVTGITINVQEHLEQNFKLAVGSVSESITVEGAAAQVNTESAAVSTLVDRQFAENLPLNGRSFQSLIQLAPGVVVVPTNVQDLGQFSVNGQRAVSNYWMVDGVSANIGVGTVGVGGNANGMAGTVGSFSSFGGTNSLVSVDAMQEFRIETSTYAPEFGRVPGGQISILTRSGSNQLHGLLFEYLRNEVLDANDWFADDLGLPKPRERQNDFGGTVGGPIVKDRLFFFFSYEGLRLRLPQVVDGSVPDANARATALPALQPFLNAYPLQSPNLPDNLATGIAGIAASYANAASLDAYSLRIDDKFSEGLSLFARYNYSPSDLTQRPGGTTALSVVNPIHFKTQTATAGATWSFKSEVANDLRFNYSQTNTSSTNFLDSFGGAIPLRSLPFPTSYTGQNALFGFEISSPDFLLGGNLEDGLNAGNVQHQFNVVDTVSVQRGTHSMKFGVDFRRLTPETTPPEYSQSTFFDSVTAAESGMLSIAITNAQISPNVLFKNLGLFAQDTWRLAPRLTLTYGLRWDVDFAPSSLRGPSLPSVTGYNLNDLSQLGIAPNGTPVFKTTYGNVAPRLGVAYQLLQRPGRETVLRGGFGVFYDLASSQIGSLIQNAPPFGNFNLIFSPTTFPLDTSSGGPGAPPAISLTPTLANIVAVNPHLELPYTLQWNVALEQALGKQQTVSASYVGASGRRLLQSTSVSFPPSNPAIQNGVFFDNLAVSNYQALQLQFQRRLSHGLQALASYTWAHSIDTGSAGSGELLSNAGTLGIGSNRGPSDFDIRHALTLGITYDIPAAKDNAFARTALGGWSMETLLQARSATPVDVEDALLGSNLSPSLVADVRPDLVPGQPLYLVGAVCDSTFQGLGSLLPGHSCPGGKGINPNAFTPPPTDPNTGYPLRQGTLGRNALRGFGATQWDFAVHRDFRLHESLKLQFRAEMFNLLNHPNFGPPDNLFGFGSFGLAQATLANSLTNGNLGNGALSPLYQMGGPRSIQFALKLMY